MNTFRHFAFLRFPRFLFAAASLVGALTVFQPATNAAPVLRPPSVPLVAHDPYFSIWSPADRLTDVTTTHWTGHAQPLRSLVRVDGQVFRVMGADPSNAPALAQASLQVLPTRTIYDFTNAQIALTLTFLTPALPSNLDVLSRPLTYLNWSVRSVDGQSHAVQLYFDAGAEIAVNTTDEVVAWSRPNVPGQTVLQIGVADPVVLGKSGDDLRIDWGSLYVAATDAQHAATVITGGAAARNQFALNGQLPAADDALSPRAVSNNPPELALAFDLGSVGASAVARQAMIAYDDIYAINYFGQPLRAYWRRNGATMPDLLPRAAADYPALAAQCAAFDAQLQAALTAVGGEHYAQLCLLAYRQTLAGNKIVADASGQPLMFPKENFSNGCIGTVDVLYPQAPFFLTFSPALTKAMLRPILDYASSSRWKFAFAPHDLGTYPWATGQVYGGGEQTTVNQMPNEETGNMLILLAALAEREGNVDFVANYWPLLRQWADFLVANGLDPANQLSSADMFGPLPHATDLALKSIIGIGAYGKLCAVAGRADEAQHYLAIAAHYAAQWETLSADNGHTRLAYDKPGTWSMKHNLVWDRVIGANLFPDAIGDAEIAWYKSVQKTFGLPVDNRTTTCLIDWALWSIAVARDPDDFETLVAPIFDYANQTPSRVPLSDWFQTTNAKQQGMQARPVVGGLFIKMLTDLPTWTNWFHRGADTGGKWAAFPVWGNFSSVAATAENEAVTWRFTTNAPAANWFAPDFDDAGWPPGAAGFGSAGTPGGAVRTAWVTSDIWLRRAFTLDTNALRSPRLRVHHDETATIYVNGVLAATLPGYTTAYGQYDLSPAASAALQPGTNVLAVHCQQTSGGQYIDAGLVQAPPVLAASAPALNHLVAFWPLNLDARDAQGNHPGQIVGATNRATGPAPFEGAIYLDGASYIKTGTNYGALFDGTQPFSVGAWIRGDTNNNDAAIVGKMTQGGDYTGWELHVGTGDLGSAPGKLNVWLINRYGDNFIQVNSPVFVLDGAWHHVAFTYDGSRKAAGVKIYVDGQDATGGAGADSLTGVLQNAVELDLGTRQNGAFHNFTGMMRGVSLWDAVLTPENVASLFQSGVALPGNKLSANSSPAAAQFGFCWDSQPGACYRIESSTNLVAWSVLEPAWPPGGATGTNTNYTTAVNAGAPCFYRISLIP
jgi:hypothetical protein